MQLGLFLIIKKGYKTMKKKLAILLLAIGILGMAVGCDKDKEESKKTEDSKQAEESLTNEEGHVVAVDVENIEDYVKLGEYKNLEVSEQPKPEVTEEVLENNIHYLLLNNYKPVEVTEDRAVQQDDTVNIDYTGYMDGKEFEGGADTGADLRIGSGGFIAGFEDGLVGHKKGEEVTLDLTFPDPYKMNESLSGKAVQFKVKINKISAPPTLSDEWVAANTDFKTVEEFRNAQKEAIQTSLDSDYDTKVKSDLFALVVKNSEIIKYPEDLMKKAKVKVREQLDMMYQSQAGITLDDYIKQQGITEEETEKALEESAQQYLTQNLIVQAILEKEGVEFTEEEYTKEKEEYAISAGFPDVATMESYADAKTIKENVLWEAACEIIQSSATITEETSTEE